MTVRALKAVPRRLDALVAQDQDLLKALVKAALDQMLQAEMTEFLGAAPGERSEGRGGYRSGYHGRQQSGSIARKSDSGPRSKRGVQAAPGNIGNVEVDRRKQQVPPEQDGKCRCHHRSA